MKKTIRMLILSVVVLAFMHPKTLPIQAGKVTGKQAHNDLPPPAAFKDQPAALVDDDWTIECVDCPKRIESLTERSLRVDSQGNPHIAYGGDHLYYAWHDGTAWHYETVDYQPDSGAFASLALDSNGFPHISYLSRHEYGSTLKYAYKDINGWNFQIIEYSATGLLSIDVDKYDRPHVAYHTEAPYASTYYLKVAHQEENIWQYETVDTLGSNETVSLAVDGQGFPHLNYFKSDQVIYAHKNASGWQYQSVADAWHFTTSLALDNKDYPHISYYSNLSGNVGLKYTYLDSEGWHTDTVDSETEADFVKYSSIALDQDGNPHISYYLYDSRDGDLPRELKYAYHDKNGWHDQVVDPLPDDLTYHNYSTSIAVGVDGQPLIAYRYNDNLELAYPDPADGWVIHTIDTSGFIGRDVSLELDSSGSPHLSYVKNDGLAYSFKDPIFWKTNFVDSRAAVSSLKLDSLDKPHIAYHDNWVNVKYAVLGENGWQIDSTIYDGEIGSGLSLALDYVGNPHIAFNRHVQQWIDHYYYPMYAYYDGSSWQVEEFTRDEFSGHDFLAIDADGYPHIGGGTQYTFKNETGWHTETPGFAYDYYLDSSLALAKDGTAHIGAVAGGIGAQYGYRDEGGWHTEIIDLVGSGNMAIAVNDLGIPHLVYSVFDKSGNNLDEIRLAYKDSLGWHIETVTTLYGGVGATSLAIDEQGQIHLAYIDETYGYLKYAVRAPYTTAAFLQPDNSSGYGLPGSTIQYTFLVTNVREQADTFNISISGNRWETVGPTSTIPLEAGQSTKIVFQVTIPPTATLGSSDTATIILTSQSDPSVTATATLTTYAAITTYLPLMER